MGPALVRAGVLSTYLLEGDLGPQATPKATPCHPLPPWSRYQSCSPGEALTQAGGCALTSPRWEEEQE